MHALWTSPNNTSEGFRSKKKNTSEGSPLILYAYQHEQFAKHSCYKLVNRL
jgi:hypothetical protein